MADLTAIPPLGGHDETTGDLRLRERGDLALVSIAVPLGGEATLAKALRSAFKLDLPDPGRFSASATHYLIRTGPDQLLLAFAHAAPDAEPRVAKALKGAAYTTDQTGAWAVLELSGPNCRTVLERICPLDLHDMAFPVGAAHRTLMEHLGVLILHTDADTFLLMSASSSAMSFLHALRTSIRYVS
ncbi:MAG: sarcosine oxidase subunit gamma family protein [Rhodobacter sp.]|nr:sarcosine oxidase subunit gamma family protein [Rhodobacter sp.]